MEPPPSRCCVAVTYTATLGHYMCRKPTSRPCACTSTGSPSGKSAWFYSPRPASRRSQASNARPGRGLGVASFLGRPLESQGRGVFGMRRPGGVLVHQGIPARRPPPQRGVPEQGRLTRPDLVALHPKVPCSGGSETLHAKAAYRASSQPALNRAFWDQATQYILRPGVAPQLVWGEGGLEFYLDRLLPPPPCVLASLVVCRLADANLERATAFGRDPLCSYHGPEGTRPLCIDGLLVDTRLAALLPAAELLSCGVIPGHTAVQFDLHLKGAS